MKRTVPESRLKALKDSWEDVEEAGAKVQEAGVERDGKILKHNRLLRSALKEQGAPSGHHINLETGEIFDPATVKR